jgi:hypothetical protein
MSAHKLLSRIAPAIAIVITLTLAGKAFAASSLEIITPSEGQKLETDQITVSWKLAGFTLTDYAKYPRNRAGQGHLHLWLDEPNPNNQNAVKVISGSTYNFTGVKSGDHTLIAELHNNDHTPVSPAARQVVKFESSVPIFVNPELPQNDFTLFLILVAIILIGGLWYFLSPELPVSKPQSHKKSSKRRK